MTKKEKTASGIAVAAVAAAIGAAVVAGPVIKPTQCACWAPTLGDCSQPDGGALKKLGHNEFQPGEWKGKGCIEKPCGATFGIDNWPKDCAK